jgi:hypothetical protein
VLGLIFLDDGGITLGRGHDDVGGGGRERDAAMVGMPEGEQQGRGRQRNEADKGGKPEDERMDSETAEVGARRGVGHGGCSEEREAEEGKRGAPVRGGMEGNGSSVSFASFKEFADREQTSCVCGSREGEALKGDSSWSSRGADEVGVRGRAGSGEVTTFSPRGQRGRARPIVVSEPR